MSESKNVNATTDASFESDVIKSPVLTVVDFWAEWCGPCKLLGPTIERIADDYVGKLKVYKMNVDDNHATPTQFHIRSIPTVIFFKNGHVGPLFYRMVKGAVG